MTKTEKEFLRLWLKNKKEHLEYLHEQHRVDIAIFNAKREMLMTDIDDLEKQLEGVKK